MKLTKEQQDEKLKKLLEDFEDYSATIAEIEEKITGYIGERSHYCARLAETAKIYQAVMKGETEYVI